MRRVGKVDGWGPVLRELVFAGGFGDPSRDEDAGRGSGVWVPGTRRWTAGRMYIEGRRWREVDEKEVGLVEWCWEVLS